MIVVGVIPKRLLETLILILSSSVKVFDGIEIVYAPIPLYITWLDNVFAMVGIEFVKVTSKLAVTDIGTKLLSETVTDTVFALR